MIHIDIHHCPSSVLSPCSESKSPRRRRRVRVRERSHARSGNFDLAEAGEAHQGTVCWTSPRTAHEQTANRNALPSGDRVRPELIVRENAGSGRHLPGGILTSTAQQSVAP